MMDIKNKVILVTGSADRVGRVIANKLAINGANIVIHFHQNKEKAIETESELRKYGTRTLIVQGDLSKREDWLEITKKIISVFRKIDVLINNAAIFYRTPFFELSEKDWDNFFQINLKSVFLGSQIIGKKMYESGFGKIINISDVSSETIWPNYIPNCFA